MSRNVIETVMGAVVLIIAAIFLVFAYTSAKVRTVSGYEVSAKFDHVDGTREGGDVRIGGIKVGTIISEKLDPKTFSAIVRMSIDNSIKLPVDTVATITSSSLLGDNFMVLVPGNDDKIIPPDGTITNTQSPTSLMSLFSAAAFSLTGGAKPAGNSDGEPQPSGPTPSKP
jgi:phospholipid/cholesterol/gamma-HCH transport system substrate-binding protein